jgi:type I restriction enzyme S subunit
VPLPPIELQREFAARVQKTEGLKAKLKASFTQAEAQFNALSQRAFAGELRRAGGEGS